MTTKRSLAELFDKAGLRPGAKAAQTQLAAQELKRELACRQFAESYVRVGFDAQRAYEDLRKKDYGTKKKHAWRWLRQRRVQEHIRAIVQEATENTKSVLRLDINELTQINEALVSADVCDYIESAVEFTPGPTPETGSYRTINRLSVRPEKLTLAQRLSIKKITMREGEVTSVEIVDKLDAMAMQIGLIELMQARGGSNNSWVGSFQARMSAARKARIEAEVRAGKVLLMPAKKA